MIEQTKQLLIESIKDNPRHYKSLTDYALSIIAACQGSDKIYVDLINPLFEDPFLEETIGAIPYNYIKKIRRIMKNDVDNEDILNNDIWTYLNEL